MTLFAVFFIVASLLGSLGIVQWLARNAECDELKKQLRDSQGYSLDLQAGLRLYQETYGHLPGTPYIYSQGE